MRRQRGSVGFYVLVLIALLSAAAYVSALTCERRWAGSGLAVEWGIVEGCRVLMPSGRWMPDDRVRDVDISSQTSNAGRVPQ